MAEILTAAQRVALARHIARPGTADFIAALFTDFFEQQGDRQSREDPSILGGIALYHGRPVTVIGTPEGQDSGGKCGLQLRYARAGGLPQGPAADATRRRNSSRPVITFVDTPGAYPGLEAEARGPGRGHRLHHGPDELPHRPGGHCGHRGGGSGGALALAVANRVLMLENAVYSVLSPEGFASILWKDAARSGEAGGADEA